MTCWPCADDVPCDVFGPADVRSAAAGRLENCDKSWLAAVLSALSPFALRTSYFCYQSSSTVALAHWILCASQLNKESLNAWKRHYHRISARLLIRNLDTTEATPPLPTEFGPCEGEHGSYTSFALLRMCVSGPQHWRIALNASQVYWISTNRGVGASVTSLCSNSRDSVTVLIRVDEKKILVRRDWPPSRSA